MPTAIATTSEPEIAVTPDLWRAYRRARAAHPERVPSYAAGLALDEAGINLDRGRLERLLGNREVEEGLRPSRAEREADDAADAAAREAARAAMVDGSIDAIEIDALKRVEELKLQIDRMSIEALTDANVATEQKAALSELTEAELALANVTRARPEAARREADAAERAEREARENARLAAVKLEPGIAKRKSEIDRLLALAAAETRGLADMQQTYNAHRAASGVDAFNLRATAFRPDSVESAVAFHFQGTGVLRGLHSNYPLVRTEVKE